MRECPVAVGDKLLGPTMVSSRYPALNGWREKTPAWYVPELDHSVVVGYVIAAPARSRHMVGRDASSPLMPLCPAVRSQRAGAVE